MEVKKIYDFGEFIPDPKKDSDASDKWNGLKAKTIRDLAKIFRRDFADKNGEFLSPYQTALFLKIAVEKLVKYYIIDYLDEQALKEQEKLVSQSITEIEQEILSALYAAKGIPESEALKELANRLTEILYQCTEQLQNYIPQLNFYVNVVLNLAKADAWARLDKVSVFGKDKKEAVIEKNIRLHLGGFYKIEAGILANNIPVKQNFKYANRRKYWYRALSLATTSERFEVYGGECQYQNFMVLNGFEHIAYPCETEEEAIETVKSLRKVASALFSSAQDDDHLVSKDSKETGKQRKIRKPQWHSAEKILARIMPKNYFGAFNATPDDFLRILGVYGCQFGNYVPQKLRQKQMNLTIEAYIDLAKILDIRTTDICFKDAENARLAISFGARGRGGFSGGIAHFEPFYEVMNFTKRKGYGCLAHEWGHAFDNFLYKSMTGETAKAKGDPFIIGVPYKSFERFNWNFLSDELTIIRDILNARHCEYRSISYAFAQKYRGGEKYWCSKCEMFARAFEAYVLDKMAEKGYVSDALVFEHEAYPYPEGEERKKINMAIDGIFSKLKEHGVFHPFDETLVVPEETKRKKILLGTDDYAANLQVGDGGQISFFTMS